MTKTGGKAIDKKAAARKAAARKRLAAFRDRHGLTQAAAAAWCGAPKRTWEGWEGGSREPPPILWTLLGFLDEHGPPEPGKRKRGAD